MQERTDQPQARPTPAQLPTAPLPPAARQALARLESTLTPTAARCTGDCNTLTPLPAPGWTQDAWGWLCPTHTHARTDRPAVTA
ncbi:hypothetical protein [Streptomyces europaeiscabiei]|uniref:hypothetical protein n=1 Tax=Streptomyces europaeiscabiei TaxID=146819 RepID=UPI000E6883C4|nr:hypothetical protein [Streptomyces europaeiscabiei]